MRGCTGHGTESIRCPFFRGHGAKEICCEGITSGSGLRLIFKRKADMQLHEQIFCSERYHYCELFEAVYRQYTEYDP